ncbi:MAG: hypothetical protein F6J87_27315 [Spirulina sp. SIO3F2]|nr:hypothetical protein [Spirulina sp. SIO3F2]
MAHWSEIGQSEFEWRFGQLPPRCRAVLLLFLVGRCDSDIAVELGIEGNTVRGHIRDARKKMNLRVEGEGYNDMRISLQSLFWKYRQDLFTSTPKGSSTTNSDPGSGQTGWTAKFVGRNLAMQDLDRLVEKEGARAILIVAKGGEGKTTLAKHWLQQRFGDDKVLNLYLAKDVEGVDSAESWVQEQIRRLGEEPGQEYGIALERLRELLSQESRGILIDNLEPALDPATGKFLIKHRSYRRLINMLTEPQLQSVTLITSREPLNEGLEIERYDLVALDQEAWQYFFENRGIVVNDAVMEAVHSFYGGNALVMKKLCHPIQRYAQGNLAGYWKHYPPQNAGLEKNIQNFLIEQLERLRACPNAYKLLCRMGCFRFQDIPRVPMEALFAILWDIPETQRLEAVQELQDRDLVEWEQDEFWLHPFVQKIASVFLKRQSDWENTNRYLADFWTNSIQEINTLSDAITAFEAYHHYMAIQDFNAAGQIISHIRTREDSELIYTNCLGTYFYIFGLLDKICYSIEKVRDSVHDYFCSTRLHTVLGYSYNLLGEVKLGIICHKKSQYSILKYLGSKNLVDKNSPKPINKKDCFEPKIIKTYRTYCASYLNIALCHIDFWDLETAKDTLEVYRQKALDYGFDESLKVSFSCLAYVFSCLEKFYLSSSYIKRSETMISLKKMYNTQWASVYNPLFLAMAYQNLGYKQEALNFYKECLEQSKAFGYKQAEARVYTGLASIDRSNSKLTSAIEKHDFSVKTLKGIGAKCDLAEAYFQYGLTCRNMGDASQSEKYRAKAIQIYEQILAPKQIERVNKLFGI